MRFSSLFVVFVAAALFVLVPACGGEGQGFRADAPAPLAIDTLLPALSSGDLVDWEIPIQGGCGGPYVLEVIAGRLPDGVGLDYENGRHHITGILLEDGDFDFRLSIKDTNCTPFSTTAVPFSWDVQRGDVRIVMADPPIIPNAEFGDPNKYENSWGVDGVAGTADDNQDPDFSIDALDTVVYGTPTVIKLTAAGGIPPYVCEVVDDPNDDFDNVGLPTPCAFAINSTSIIGAPIQVLAGGLPFRITVRVTDFAGQSSERKFQWKIDTPPIIQANVRLVDGTAGSPYGDNITIVDGVPPIQHEFVDDVPSDDGTVDNLYVNNIQFGGPVPVVPQTRDGKSIMFTATGTSKIPGDIPNSARLDPADLGDGIGRSVYPAPGDTTGTTGGTYRPYPSEGMYLDDTQSGGAGTVQGVPRRWGEFEVFAHSWSTLVPNERGQHAIKALALTVKQADPLMAIQPGWTVEKAWPTTPGEFATMPEFEIGQPYDPDKDGFPGLQLVATGGVASDGYFDNPHESERNDDPSEPPADSYNWRYDWDPSTPYDWATDTGTLDPAPAGLGSGQDGVVNVIDSNALVRTGKVPVNIGVNDYMLPNQGKDDVTVNYSVGPDVAILTYSTTSQTASYLYWASGGAHAMNDPYMRIFKFELFSGTTGPKRGPLTDNEMVANHTIPAIAGISGPNQLGALLSGLTSITGHGSTGGGANLDLIRATVNATGWWDDHFHMNPKGAQPSTHADMNRGGSTQYYGGFGSSYSSDGNYNPSVTAVTLPDTPSVTHAPANGVYADGGRLYPFESDEQFGLFVIRSDAKVYVPFAQAKPSSNSSGFGEVLQTRTSYTSRASALRMVVMTVSPDGRVAALKLKNDQDNLYEHADQSTILFVSLTGEKMFNGGTSTYRKVTVPATGLTGGGNRIMYAQSMALTNDYLYFLIGRYSPVSNTDTYYQIRYWQSWAGMNLMRCKVAEGSPDSSVHLLPGPSSDPSNYWTQDDGLGSSMQSVYQHHGPNASTSSSYWGLAYSSGFTYGEYFCYDGMGLNEHNVAPTPFRVSANGKAVAFFAAADRTTTSTSSSGHYSNFCWVDYDGGGATRVTNTRRHHSMGSARSHRIVYGPSSYRNWGRFHGPTPGVEIADNGLAVVFNYNTASSISVSGSSGWYSSRSNVIVTTSSSGTWGSYSERDITSAVFGGSHRWRFGSFAFTTPMDGAGNYDPDQASDGVVFWGGSPMYYSTYSSSSYNESHHFQGTYYIYKLTDTNKVTTMCSTSNGGHTTAGKEYTSASQMNPSGTSGRNNRFGSTYPYGGFMSKNRKFMYVAVTGALTSSDPTFGKLIGLNVRSTNASASINGHADGRGFLPGNWPSRRGFFTGCYYTRYGMRYIQQQGYFPNHTQGQGFQIMAKDSGTVFWVANYQGYTTTSYSSSYGPHVYTTAYNYVEGHGGTGVYGFNPDVGGSVANLHKSSWATNSTSSTYWGKPNFLDTNRDGSRLMLTFTTYYGYYLTQEQIRWMNNIGFNNTTGAMNTGFSQSSDTGGFQTSDGRAGESYAIVDDGRDVYYTFGGSGNENGKTLYRQRFDEATGTWTKTSDTTGTGRMNVLFAGR